MIARRYRLCLIPELLRLRLWLRLPVVRARSCCRRIAKPIPSSSRLRRLLFRPWRDLRPLGTAKALPASELIPYSRVACLRHSVLCSGYTEATADGLAHFRSSPKSLCAVRLHSRRRSHPALLLGKGHALDRGWLAV